MYAFFLIIPQNVDEGMRIKKFTVGTYFFFKIIENI